MKLHQSAESELLAMSRISSEGFIVFTPTTHATNADFIVYDRQTTNAYTVQVKSTETFNSRRKHCYIFDIRKPNGKYEAEAFDIYAFVVTSTREVRFEWKSNMPSKSQITFNTGEEARYPWFPNTLRSILDGAQ